MTGLSVSAHGLVHIYRMQGNDVIALTSVDLEIAPGQMVGLLGPSGAGKSTLLRLLAGLHRPSAGRLRVGERDLATIETSQLSQMRSNEVSIVLQGAANNLLPYLSPADNVAFAQDPARRNRRQLPSPREVLTMVDLADCGHRGLAELTPGQLQRVAVAVGMAALPGLLLADEPTSQLDHGYRDEVLDSIAKVNRELGTTVVTVTHDPQVAARFGRTITIRDGRVGAEGRDGEEFAVLGRDGSLQLPPHVRDVLAPGTLLRVRMPRDGLIELEATSSAAENPDPTTQPQ